MSLLDAPALTTQVDVVLPVHNEEHDLPLAVERLTA